MVGQAGDAQTGIVDDVGLVEERAQALNDQCHTAAGTQACLVGGVVPGQIVQSAQGGLAE